MATARQADVSIFMEEPGPLTVLQVLSMTVEELRTELQSRNLMPAGTTKPDLQQALLSAVAPLPPVQPPSAVTTPTTDASLGARPRTSSGQNNSAVGLQLQLRRLELEAEERKRQMEAAERKYKMDLEAAERQKHLEASERQKQREHDLEMKRLEMGAQSGAAPTDDHRQAPAFRVDTAVKLIPKFNEHDVESFLISFEKIAQLNQFPEDKYAAILQAHLTGKALKVFTELTVEDCQDYSKLKEALLTAYAVVPEVYRKRFRNLNRHHSETFSEFAFRLSVQFRRWLESEGAYNDLEHLRELIQLEQFNTSLDTDLRSWLLDQKPKNLTEAAQLADQHVAVHSAGRPGQTLRDWKRQPHHGGSPRKFSSQPSKPPASTSSSTGSQPQAKPPSSDNRPKFSQASASGRPKVVCFYCKAPGHVISNCRKRLDRMSGTPSQEAPVQLLSTVPRTPDVTSDAKTAVKQKEPMLDPRFEQHCSPAQLVRPDSSVTHVRLLRDTGALQSLVCSRILTDTDYAPTGEFRLIRGITGEVISVPLVKVTLSGSLCKGTYLCGLVSTLPDGIAVLVGNDICTDVPVADVSVVTRSQTAQARQSATQTVATPADTTTLSSDAGLSSSTDHVDDVTDLSPLFDEAAAQPPPSIDSVDRAELIRLQQADPDLKNLFDLVDKEEHPYSFRSGVLVRAWRDKLSPHEATYHQVVVPTVLRAKLLSVAHDIPAAGHLGVAKTKDRLLRHFYWPSINKDVKEFCRSCDVCQRLGKGAASPPAPLHSLPLVSEPFCQIAIDIVGPMPVCKDSGNRFILTVLDLCTHYPEAIPLKQHTAQDVAQALANVFSHFGFPQEILSDQGSDFMSALMQIFLHDFGIDQIRSSAYHPQTNGACERFNGTLKSMLRSLTEKFPDSWDTALPWILFAYREVPVETLGCSPFDLLFGRTVAGPLSLLKSAWLQETDLHGAKQNVVEFILGTRERLRHALDVATEHATQERSRAKRWYDRRACHRTFQPGDKVLVLLPIPGNPLQAKFHGPYVVEQQLGPVDYVVSTPDRRKTKRVCHVNLLKAYHERDPRFVICVLTEPVTVAHETVPDENNTSPTVFDALPELPSEEQAELKAILTEFADVFSDKPGKTTLSVHHIELLPNTQPIRSAPYRLHPEKREFLRKELDDLLQQGIIEESESPWASPIVMVPKADGTLRLCTDFRKVNAVTVPDPFPLPRVEDLLDRVGQARYLTKLDMTRGYWQVPLDEESVPISAIVTPFGHYQWRYMPFGLRNAPATFSRIVAKLLRGLDDFSGAYLDDIINFSQCWEAHANHLRTVLTRIRDAHLTLSPTKCQFAAAELDYLGHHIGLGRVQPRQKKVEALLTYPAPQSKKQLQSFLGLAGYYRKFVPNYAHISSILSDLLKKGSRFFWTKEADAAFLDLKSRLATQPVLRPPDYALPFCLSVDASDLAIGATLFQVVDGLEHPICFYSKKLDTHQRRYSTIEKEALSLILAVRYFSVYFGTGVVTVYTDHNPLVFLQRMANHNQKLLRWSLELQQYNFNIIHRAGKDNLLADLLSRGSPRD